MSRFLVTGGAGFIGSNIVERLVKDGHEVIAVDNLSTGKFTNIEHLVDNDVIEFAEGDVRDFSFCCLVCRGVDFVLHQAALGSVPRSIADPFATNDHNVRGTLNVLLAARDMGVRRVVVASSSSVYGDTETLPKVESMRPMPRSPYAVSKLAEECYAQAFHVAYRMSTVALRYSNVFGPKQNPAGDYAAVIPRFIEAALTGHTLNIFGNGAQTRDFTFVDDVVEANLLACSADARVSGEVFNVATGMETSLLGLVTSLEKILHRDLTRCHVEARLGDVWHSRLDVSHARHLLGYIPKVSFDEGLKRTVEHFAASLQP